MLIFYDFEVFKYDWLVVCINPIDDTKMIIHNDKKALEKFYNDNKESIWVGFNSRNYDQYILKGILLDFDPYEISQWIIAKERKGWEYSNAFNRIKLYNYDVSKGKTDYGLKTLEAFMGNDIKETEVPFNLDRPLNRRELSQTIKYCTHDVEQTIEVFKKRKDDFDTQLALITEFGLDLSNISKTTAQLIAVILGANKKIHTDEWQLRLPKCLQLNKYRYIAEWYLDSRNHDYDNKLDVMVADCPHTFAWGGVHGAISKYSYECKPDELMIMADATSLYPSIMIMFDLQSRSITDKNKFISIYTKNLQMKINHDPKRPLYKLICNTTYGCMGDDFNPLYDKLHQNLVCVYGQMLLLDLIEHLELYIKLIQSNTDGILFVINRKDFNLIDNIIAEWEERTQLSMEFSFVNKIFQKDVNNYVIVGTKVKSKGSYVKKLSELDNDLPVVNKAIVNYFVNGESVADYINKCDELLDFQKIYKLTSKYDYVEHNFVKYYWKSYRVFASLDKTDTTLYKCKGENKKDKFALSPENSKIINEDIKGFKVPDWLDRNYYIDLANRRLEHFGANNGY